MTDSLNALEAIATQPGSLIGDPKMILVPALVVASVAVPAILTAFTPRRWLGRAIVGWAASPVAAYVGVLAWETATRPGSRISFSNVLLGFSLLSAIFVLPWAISCVAGFATGFAFRRLRKRAGDLPVSPQPRPPPRPAATTPDPPRPVAATPSDAGSGDGLEWRSAHLGFEKDGLQIDGLDVWGLAWVRVDTAPLRLPHPAHAEQMHRFTVQEISVGAARARFAVSELSNGVWGFYVPRQQPVHTGAVSADGSLRYEQRSGERAASSPPGVASWAVLIDAKTGRVLADCEGWPASNVISNPDGSLFLRLGQDDGETLLRIDPSARTFRNHGDGGADRDLDELAATISEIRRTRANLPPSPHYRRISPDGSICVDTVAVEWGNSHWVHTPRVIEVASGRVVLDLWNTDWDATVSWPGPRRVSLDFRRYHFSGDLTIELDLAAERYRITREPGAEAELTSGALNDAENAMEASGRRVAAFAASLNAARPIWDGGARPSPFAAWRSALVILTVAVVLVAVAGGLSIMSQPAPEVRPRRLREIPTPDLSASRAAPPTRAPTRSRDPRGADQADMSGGGEGARVVVGEDTRRVR